MWYYLKNDEMSCSISFEEIVNLINAGVITSSTYVWQSGKMRQRAGQVGELAPYFQNLAKVQTRQTQIQNAASPPEATSSGTNTKSTGVRANTQSGSGVKYRSRRLTKQSEGAPVSKNEKVGRIILIVCLVIAVISLLLVFPFCTTYKEDLERHLMEFSQTGFYSSVSDEDIFVPFYILVIVTLIAFITGFFIKQYKLAVACLIIAIICLSYPTNIKDNAEQHRQQIEQRLNAIPGYQDYKNLATQCSILSVRIWDLNHQGAIQDSVSNNMINELESIRKNSKIAITALVNGSNDSSLELRYQEYCQTVLQMNEYIKGLR